MTDFRTCRLSKMGFSSYLDYIQSPIWVNLRAAYLSIYPECCFVRDKKRESINGISILHHIYYGRLGEERNEDLTWICLSHDLLHRCTSKIGKFSYRHFALKKLYQKTKLSIG